MPERRALWASTKARGGIARFVTTVAETPLWDEWNVRLVVTHTNGNAFVRLGYFIKGGTLFLVEVLLRRPAVVHVHSAAYGSFVRKALLTWVSRLFHIPVVFHMHGADLHLFHDEAPRLMQTFIRRTLESAAAVVALGSAWAVRLRAIAPAASIVVIPNSVPLKTSVDQFASGDIQVTFLGEIGDRKGTFTLIEAWRAVARANAERSASARLTIAGDGDVQRARDLVTEYGLTDSVLVEGWKPSAEVEELLARTKVLVLPSRDEGQPMAILEAMSRGIAVVSTPVGGIPEMLQGEAGILVSPDDPVALGAALNGLIDDAPLRARIGQAAHTRVRRDFEVAAVSTRFDDLYRAVTGYSP